MTTDSRATEEDLRKRQDVNDADIPRIIERAQELQDALQQKQGVSGDEVESVSHEQQVENVHIEAALAELEAERANTRSQEAAGDALAEGLPMDRGFMVGAVVGILALFAIPLLIQRDDAEEEPLRSRSAILESSTQSTATQADDEPDTREGSRVETGSLSLPEPLSEGGLGSALQGRWVLRGLLSPDGGGWVDASFDDEYPDMGRERWEFMEGDRFHHTMPEGLWFSGLARTTPVEGLGAQLGLEPAEWLLMESREISSSVVGVEHMRDYHLLSLHGDELQILYIGDSLQGRGRPVQGGRFVRE
jgi:hypothetical protein